MKTIKWIAKLNNNNKNYLLFHRPITNREFCVESFSNHTHLSLKSVIISLNDRWCEMNINFLFMWINRIKAKKVNLSIYLGKIKRFTYNIHRPQYTT